MRIALFYHSLVSDWNHGNAHFLRGIATELQARGHVVRVYEPADAWSVRNLRAEHGEPALRRFREAYPSLESTTYDLATFDVAGALADVDLVLVHEWNAPELVRAIGAARRTGSFVALFHDTHHRLVTAPGAFGRTELEGYDGVLAYGRVLRDRYLAEGLAARAWTWHEAADTRVFHPRPDEPAEGDLVWVGNWGDGERSAELAEFLLRPIHELRLHARVYGVRYPAEALQALAAAGVEYGGWLPNQDAPALYSRFKVTVHIPRRPYTAALPGIPTIRVFEALACGIPLVCSPWMDSEGLFTPGRDFLVAQDGAEMTAMLRKLLATPGLRRSLAEHGRQTILRRHTCAHRVDELLAIVGELRPQWQLDEAAPAASGPSPARSSLP